VFEHSKYRRPSWPRTLLAGIDAHATRILQHEPLYHILDAGRLVASIEVHVFSMYIYDVPSLSQHVCLDFLASILRDRPYLR
jgi:hypothetical protein